MSNFTKLLMLSLVFGFVSCKKSNPVNNIAQNSFKINNDEYALANAYYAVDSADGYTALVFVSPGLTYNPSTFNLSGNGNLIEFDISDISATLNSGNYYNPTGFWSGVALNYTSSTSPGNEYEINTSLPGTLNITKSNSIYTIQYEYTLTTGQIVTGQFVGQALKARF